MILSAGGQGRQDKTPEWVFHRVDYIYGKCKRRQNGFFPLFLRFHSGAQEKTRTSMTFLSHGPEPCASTNSATWACQYEGIRGKVTPLLTYGDKIVKQVYDLCPTCPSRATFRFPGLSSFLTICWQTGKRKTQ